MILHYADSPTTEKVTEKALKTAFSSVFRALIAVSLFSGVAR